MHREVRGKEGKERDGEGGKGREDGGSVMKKN